MDLILPLIRGRVMDVTVIVAAGNRATFGLIAGKYTRSPSWPPPYQSEDVSTIDFIQKYLRPMDNRFSLLEVPVENGFDCIFFNSQKKACSIYEVRPHQCRQFPFWEIYRTYWQSLVKECPGVSSFSDT